MGIVAGSKLSDGLSNEDSPPSFIFWSCVLRPCLSTATRSRVMRRLSFLPKFQGQPRPDPKKDISSFPWLVRVDLGCWSCGALQCRKNKSCCVLLQVSKFVLWGWEEEEEEDRNESLMVHVPPINECSPIDRQEIKKQGKQQKETEVVSQHGPSYNSI